MSPDRVKWDRRKPAPAQTTNWKPVLFFGIDAHHPRALGPCGLCDRCAPQAADERYRGGPDKPFTQAELHAKFTDCAQLTMAGGRIPKAIEQITTFSTGRHAQSKVAGAANALSAFFKAPAAHAIIRAKGMNPI